MIDGCEKVNTNSIPAGEGKMTFCEFIIIDYLMPLIMNTYYTTDFKD
jgi:hypothetical protein